MIGSFRKLLLLSAVFCLIGVLPIGVQASEDGFQDIQANHWAYDSVAWASANGIVDGYPNGTFQPDQPVSQMEFMAMLLRTFKPGDFNEEAGKDNSWSAPYMNYMSQMRWRYISEANEPDQVKNTNGEPYASRGFVAQLVGAANGRHYNRIDAVKYVLDAGFSEGKISASVEGYMASDTLTRAEAVTFVRRLKDKMMTVYPSPRLETTYDSNTWQLSPAESMPLQVQSPSGDPMFQYSHIGFDQPTTGYVLINKPTYTVTGAVYKAYGDSLTVRVDEVRTPEGFSPIGTVVAPMKDGTFRAELVMPSPGLYRVSVESESHVVHRQGTALITWFYIEYKPVPQ